MRVAGLLPVGVCLQWSDFCSRAFDLGFRDFEGHNLRLGVHVGCRARLSSTGSWVDIGFRTQTVVINANPRPYRPYAQEAWLTCTGRTRRAPRFAERLLNPLCQNRMRVALPKRKPFTSVGGCIGIGFKELGPRAWGLSAFAVVGELG